MDQEFVRNFDSLKKIYDFTEEFFNSNDVAESVRYPVHFALEELFTNMVKYNPGNMNTIVVDLDAEPDKVRVTIIDYDVDKFDVSKQREVDTESAVEDRPVGGLGLHLIQHMVDTLDYHYEDRQSRITFTKGTG